MNDNLSALRDPTDGSLLVEAGDCLRSSSGIYEYQVVGSIPRFVSTDNYAADFGKQWNAFKNTQLDSFTGIPVSEERLARCMNGHLDFVRQKRVLEAGSGAGRFSEVLLSYGAILHSFDYSSAVEANRDNNGHSNDFLLVQADVRSMPFQKEAYDYVICLGVVQHTPNPEETIRHLWKMVRPGGYLVMDHYIFKWKKKLPPPIGGAQEFYRLFILLLPAKRRMQTVKRIVDFFFPMHWSLRNSRMGRRILSRVSPVCFYYDEFGLSDKNTLYQWALLDTHDGTTDVFIHLRTAAQISSSLSELGATEIVFREAGNGVEAFCKKPI
jgi:2-polyprenyl-3-methyl-5-hydroxy-6-metoxy-1,4-benzoquinol methylase